MQRLRYPDLSPDGVAPLRALEHYLNSAIALPAVLLELVRLRCSLRNGCTFCIALHSAELRKHHEPQTRIDAVAAWPGTDAFTPREAAALAWADAITGIQQGHASDEAYAAVSHFFQDKDLTDLTLAIASINAWNRMAIAFRPEAHAKAAPSLTPAPSPSTAQPTPNTTESAQHELAQHEAMDDGGKVAHD